MGKSDRNPVPRCTGVGCKIGDDEDLWKQFVGEEMKNSHHIRCTVVN